MGEDLHCRPTPKMRTATQRSIMTVKHKVGSIGAGRYSAVYMYVCMSAYSIHKNAVGSLAFENADARADGGWQGALPTVYRYVES